MAQDLSTRAVLQRAEQWHTVMGSRYPRLPLRRLSRRSQCRRHRHPTSDLPSMPAHDVEDDKGRNVAECFFNHVKRWHALASRGDRHAVNEATSVVVLAAIADCSRSDEA